MSVRTVRSTDLGLVRYARYNLVLPMTVAACIAWIGVRTLTAAATKRGLVFDERTDELWDGNVIVLHTFD